MANFIKCEWCGGEMTLSADGVTAECEYCGRRTVWKEPKGESLVLEMNRANSYRRANRFSDAIMSYRLITEKNPKDAEAWWGLVLSTYGIEYVKDPRGGYVPTCHRTVREEIFENGDYRKAYALAADGQKGEYEEEAKEIDRLQKEILRLADAGEDYDVFISFKSKDRAGRMTRDARVARILYDELEKRGIRTFFSDVTLRGKMFSDYEPVIYRALTSCKYFILVGTCDEYIHSEWVTNEWSRFEERMEREKLSGVACAVFDGGAVKELPEFLRAQGADLRDYPAGGYEIHVADAVEAKMGRKKRSREEEEILKRIEEQKKAQRELEEQLKGMRSSGGSAQTRGASATVDSLLLRAEQELEAKNYDEATAYYNRVLDADPKCGEAWWGLFLAGEGINNFDFIDKLNADEMKKDRFISRLSPEQYAKIMLNRNYINAKKYAMGQFKEKIENFDKILAQNAKKKIVENKNKIANIMNEGNDFSEEVERQVKIDETKKTELQNKLAQQEQIIRTLRPIVEKYKKKAKMTIVPWWLWYFVGTMVLLPVAVVYVLLIAPILAIVRRKNRKIYKEYSLQLENAEADLKRTRAEIDELGKRVELNATQSEIKFENLVHTCSSLEDENKIYERFLKYIFNGSASEGNQKSA